VDGGPARRFVVLGRVGPPYGVRGWFKVVPFTGAPHALLGFAAWRMSVRGEREPREFRLSAGREHGGALVAKVEGVDSPEAAGALKGSTIEVPREALAATGPGEVYLADLPGCTVVNRSGAVLGTVAAVEDFGAHPLLRVAAPGGGETLIPLVDAYVEGVDLEERLIEVDWEAGD